MKRLLLVMLVVSFITSSAFAVTTKWTGSTSSDWFIAGNWDTQVPTNADRAAFEAAVAGAIINGTAVTNELYLGYKEAVEAASLTMNSGTLDVSKLIYLGADSGYASTGKLIVNGGTITVTGDDKLYVGHKSGTTGLVYLNGGVVDAPKTYVGNEGTGHVYMSGGALNCTNELRVGVKGTGSFDIAGGGTVTARKLVVGRYAGSVGEVTLSWGGVINVTDDLELGREGTATLEITGGLINVTDKIKMSESGGTSTLNLYGGQIIAEDFQMYDAGASMDIQLGVLLLGGDHVADIEAYVAGGQITAFGGVGDVLVNYHSVWDQTIVNAVIPEPATMLLLGLGGLFTVRRRSRK